MSRHNKTGRSKRGPPFVQLFHQLLRSEAWLTSRPLDRAILVQLTFRFVGNNNGRLAMSVRDAAKECCADKDACSAAFRRLEERGLIECVLESSFGYKMKRAREWRLTWHRCDVTAAPPSHNYRRWTVRLEGTGPKSGDLSSNGIHGPDLQTSQSLHTGLSPSDGQASVRPERTATNEFANSPVPQNRTHIDLAIGPPPGSVRSEAKRDPPHTAQTTDAAVPDADEWMMW